METVCCWSEWEVKLVAADLIKVHTEKLNEDSIKIASYLRDLKEQEELLANNIMNLNNMWEGEAYQAFKEAVDTDLAGLMTLIENLENVYKYEINAKTEYESCEKQVAGLISEITIKRL